MKISIPVVTRLQDNGDGGYTLYCYNNNDELIKDHPKFKEWDTKKKQEVFVQPTQEQIDEILDGEDEYENGYLGKDTIEIEFDTLTETAKLAKRVSFHAGQ